MNVLRIAAHKRYTRALVLFKYKLLYPRGDGCILALTLARAYTPRNPTKVR